MMYSMADLRSIKNGDGPIPGKMMTMDETVRWLNECSAEEALLNEAFYGRKQVEKIQKAMDNIYEVYRNDNNVDMKFHSANKDLEKAIQECFGFRRCTVYWANGADMKTGPFTCPAAHIFTEDGAYIKVGENRNGYYDKDHRINVAISSDLCLFSDPYGLTSEEMVAIFMHEIGHNFDYTMWGIINGWFAILRCLIGIIEDLMQGRVSHAAGRGIGTGIGMLFKSQPIIGVYINNIPDLIMNIIPPIGVLCRMVGRAVNPFMKLLNNIFNQMRWFTNIPIIIMNTPFSMFGNIFLRKGEVYADSFAAAYGYGAEQIEALKKMNIGRVETDPINLGPITGLFNDLALLQREVIATCTMGHGSVQQRALRMADAVEQSLNQSGLTEEDKRSIRAEKERIMEVYHRYVELDPERKNYITHLYRTMIDNWYAGKPYAVIPELDKNYAS